MPKTYINKQEKIISPKWDALIDSMDWARQYPASYKVYGAGLIEYTTEKDLTIFLVKWG